MFALRHSHRAVAVLYRDAKANRSVFCHDRVLLAAAQDVAFFVRATAGDRQLLIRELERQFGEECVMRKALLDRGCRLTLHSSNGFGGGGGSGVGGGGGGSGSGGNPRVASVQEVQMSAEDKAVLSRAEVDGEQEAAVTGDGGAGGSGGGGGGGRMDGGGGRMMMSTGGGGADGCAELQGGICAHCKTMPFMSFVRYVFSFLKGPTVKMYCSLFDCSPLNCSPFHCSP